MDNYSLSKSIVSLIYPMPLLYKYLINNALLIIMGFISFLKIDKCNIFVHIALLFKTHHETGL